MSSRVVTSFNAGEISPLLIDRVDVEKYASGCLRLKNMLVMNYGGVRRRPGLEYMGAAKHADKECALVEFEFSTDTSFMIEMGEEYFRFWTSAGQVEDPGSPGDPLELASPYQEEHLFEIQVAGANDVLYLFHGSYPTQKLTRVADDDWTIEEVAWNWPAFLAENLAATTITPSATTGSITLTASAATFESSHVGSYWRISHSRPTGYINLAISGNGTSSAIKVLGNWTLNTYGTWLADLQIEQSYDNSTWTTKRAYHSESDRNISDTASENEEIWLRLKVANWVSGASSPHARLEVTDATHRGLVKITGYTSTTVVSATVVTALFATSATVQWSEGAWSAKRGYPRTGVFHEQRLVVGGTDHQRNTFWGSVIGDFENFLEGVNDDASFSYALGSNNSNIIQWMSSHSDLLIGTSGDEWRVASSSESPITPTDVRCRKQSAYGSDYRQALSVDDGLVFIERKGRTIQEFTYSFEQDGYVGADLTLLAEHVTYGGIKDCAFQQQYDATLWFTTNEGALASLVYDRKQNIAGWSELLTGQDNETPDSFEAVAAKYGPSTASDEVWVVVRRTIDGSVVRYIERMDPTWRETQDAEDQNDLFYVDSGVKFDMGSLQTVIDDLDHLEGCTVQILGDGSVQPTRVVTGGEITLQTAARYLSIGLGYESIVSPMPQFFETQQGNTAGRKMQVSKVKVSVYLSRGFFVASDEASANWFEYFSRRTSDPTNAPPPLRSDQCEIVVGAGWQERGTIAVRQTYPLPLTVLALVLLVDAYGK